MTSTARPDDAPVSATGTLRSLASARRTRLAQAFAGAAFHAIDRIGRYDILVATGMRRSGNHAVLNWVMAQAPTACVFFNNVRATDIPYRRHVRESRIRRPRTRPLAIFSYEDLPLDQVLGGPMAELLARHAARGCGRAMALTILRDPRNMFASRMRKWPERFRTEADMERDRRLFLTIAGPEAQALQDPGGKAAAGATGETAGWEETGGGEETGAGLARRPVLFDRFVADRGYRDELSRFLGIGQGDRGLDEVPVYGHGSSFDGTTADGAAASMSVFSRHEEYHEDPRFRALVDDPRVRSLTARLFPPAAPPSSRSS